MSSAVYTTSHSTNSRYILYQTGEIVRIIFNNLLFILGIPGNVSNFGFDRNYSSGILTTFWEPLPTLDITDRDPDIIYRVQIFKTTCDQNILLSDENVTESITSNSLSPLELMEIYLAIITPRNNVSVYINGPRKAIKGWNNVHIYYILIIIMHADQIFNLPAIHHDLVYFFGTPRGWSKTYAFVYELYKIQTCARFKRFVSETPYLIHDTAKAPHITGSGVLLVVEGLQ